MNLLGVLLSPAVIGLVALLIAVLWMLKDEKDKTRPILVFALVLNLFYGWLLSVVLGRADGLLPWKYDHVLLCLDDSLGLSSASIALPFQGIWQIPLKVVYELMVPMMVFWYLLSRNWNRSGPLVFAYVAELVGGPILYAVLPACGPIYALGTTWLHSPVVRPNLVRLSGMPNAFPSLHLGTALLFVLFAEGKFWRIVSVGFLLLTALATLTAGQHYVIDLVPGLAFGCFAAALGQRRKREAFGYFGVALSWSVAVRFGYGLLIAHPALVRSFVAITVAVVVHAVWRGWHTAASQPTDRHVAATLDTRSGSGFQPEPSQIFHSS